MRMSTIIEQPDHIPIQLQNDTIYDLRMDRQGHEFTSTIEDIIKTNISMREQHEMEEMRKKYPNHPMFKKQDDTPSKIDHILRDVEIMI